MSQIVDEGSETMSVRWVWGLAVMLAALGSGGCITTSTLLVNDRGDWVRCDYSGHTIHAGAIYAGIENRNCVSDFMAIGYRPVRRGQ